MYEGKVIEIILGSNELENMRRELGKLKKKIKLILFTDVKRREDGTRFRTCSSCEESYHILKKLEELSEGKVTIEENSIETEKDLVKRYKILRIPCILFTDDNGNEIIKYLIVPSGPELVPFLQTLRYYSGEISSYRDQILSNLNKIPKSNIKIFITKTCPYCPMVVPIVNLFSILSNGKIKAEIIDLEANLDLALKYQIQRVPHAIINEQERIYGLFTPQDLLEKLTRGKRDLGGMYA
ncbi:MAG: thioredoxin family protein [Candidatus Helarchaeota archaeon]